MIKFKVGDRVRRLTDGVEDWGVAKGGIYTVSGFDGVALKLEGITPWTFDPFAFEIVPSLEDALRTDYPEIYWLFQRTGVIPLPPEKVFTVRVSASKSSGEDAQSIQDFLDEATRNVPGLTFSNVKVME